jgi:hypothetical protein
MGMGFGAAVLNLVDQAHTIAEQDRRKPYSKSPTRCAKARLLDVKQRYTTRQISQRDFIHISRKCSVLGVLVQLNVIEANKERLRHGNLCSDVALFG